MSFPSGASASEDSPSSRAVAQHWCSQEPDPEALLDALTDLPDEPAELELGARAADRPDVGAVGIEMGPAPRQRPADCSLASGQLRR